MEKKKSAQKSHKPDRIIPRSKRTGAQAHKYVKFVFVGVLFLSIIFVIGSGIGRFVKSAELFKIKEIVRSPSLQFVKSRHLTGLRGKNIFDVDLKIVGKRLRSQYPGIKQLRVFRKFPDKIYVTARKRKPFAFLTAHRRNILLDRDGIILSLRAAPNTRLPSISGVSLSKGVTLGSPLRRREVDIALDIIKTIRENRASASLDVASIDVGSLSEIYITLSNGLKVIIDQKRIYQKIRKLGILLSQGNLDFKNINYIDLRFKEPVVGKK